MTNGTIPRVVIVGAGFGGLTAARRLARHPLRLTLIDRRTITLFNRSYIRSPLPDCLREKLPRRFAGLFGGAKILKCS